MINGYYLYKLFLQLQYEMKFKVQILQCILTSDPILMKKNKTNHICNKKTEVKTLKGKEKKIKTAWMEGQFGGEWTHVYVWLNSSAVHLKPSQRC